MPLSILIPMILVGLPLVIGLVWWVSKEKVSPYLTKVSASDRFLIDYPNARIETVLISDDGAAAILKIMGQKQVGLVYRMGQNFLTRMIDQNGVERSDFIDKTFVLQLRDFTLRKVVFKDASGETKHLLSGSTKTGNA